MFNALKYIRSLEAVGFKREQAEAQVQLVVDALEEDVATKADLNEVRFDLKSEFADVRAEFAEIKSDLSEMKAKMNQLDVRMTNLETNLENRIVLRLGRTIVVCSTLMLAAIGLMLKFQ